MHLGLLKDSTSPGLLKDSTSPNHRPRQKKMTVSIVLSIEHQVWFLEEDKIDD